MAQCEDDVRLPVKLAADGGVASALSRLDPLLVAPLRCVLLWPFAVAAESDADAAEAAAVAAAEVAAVVAAVAADVPAGVPFNSGGASSSVTWCLSVFSLAESCLRGCCRSAVSMVGVECSGVAVGDAIGV